MNSIHGRPTAGAVCTAQRAAAGAALLLLLAGLGAPALAQPPAQGASASIYTCVDRLGRKLTSDRPISECLDREQRELGPSGTVRRVLGPTLTDHERAALEAQQRKAQDERNRLQEERRRERVLLARYPDQGAHDAERSAALALVEEAGSTAAKHIGELRQQRKALDLELEFYRKDAAKAPLQLRRQLAENEQGVLEQQRYLAAQEQEKRRVNQRFDAELAQLRRLWAQQSAPASLPPDTRAPLPTSAPGGR